MKLLFIKMKNKIFNFIKSITLLRAISYLLVILFSIIFFWIGSTIQYSTNEGYQDLHDSPLEIEYTKAKVIKIVDKWVVYGTDEQGKETDVILEKGYIYLCELLDGIHKGKNAYIIQKMVEIESVTINELTIGSNIYTRVVDKESINYFLQNYTECEYKDLITYSFSASNYSIDRSPTLITLLLVFILLLLLFSRIKGFHTLLAIFLVCASIILVYIPAVLSGANIYLWTIIICLYSIIETLILLEGITKKSITAIIGCISGIIISASICLIVNKTMNIMGTSSNISDEEYWISTTYYDIFNQTATIDLRAVIFSSVLFGALGAIMDVSMSLASSLLEVYNSSTNHSIKNTMKSGFNIGRDMLGTMSNTLILAYLSTSLALMLYYVSHFHTAAILKQEFFALAISQALIGCIGILITIPLTSLICGLLYNKKSEWFSIKTKDISLEKK